MSLRWQDVYKITYKPGRGFGIYYVSTNWIVKYKFYRFKKTAERNAVALFNREMTEIEGMFTSEADHEV